MINTSALGSSVPWITELNLGDAVDRRRRGGEVVDDILCCVGIDIVDWVR